VNKFPFLALSTFSYKNVDAVAEVSHQVGIATKVARLVPIGVTKG